MMDGVAEKEEFVEFDYFSLWIEKGIICFDYKHDVNFTLDIVKHMVAERIKLSNGVTRPMLLNVKNRLSIEDEARKLLSSKEFSYFLSAGAILVATPTIRWAVNILVHIDAPVTPTKLFIDKKEALEWLELFKYMN